MAKKVKKAEKATEGKATPKDVLVDANKAMTTFLKKNGLARDEDHSKSKKYGSEYKELALAIEKASDALDAGNTKATKVKADTKVKEKKSGEGKAPGRATQYDYPEGLTSAEKKEFRVKARREAKAASKGDSPKATKEDKAPKAEKAKASSGGKKEVAKEETKKIKSSGDKKKKKKVSNND